MSRDLTPEEMLAFEKYNLEHGGNSIIDSMKSLTWTYKGEMWPAYSKETIEACEKFLYLGKLFEGFADLHKEVVQICGDDSLLRKYEDELAEYIERCIDVHENRVPPYEDELLGYVERETRPESFVIKWFHGKLASEFYCNTQNNELFREEVLEAAKEKARDPFEDLEQKISEAEKEKKAAGKQNDKDIGR